MPKTFKTEENGTAILTTVPDEIDEIFGDGVGQMLVGFPLTKVSVFRQEIADPSSSEVERKVVAVLQLPTLAFIQLGKNLENMLRGNNDQVRAFHSQLGEYISSDPTKDTKSPKH